MLPKRTLPDKAFKAFSVHVWRRAVGRGWPLMRGILLGFFISACILGLQSTFGWIPKGADLARWLTFLSPYIGVLVILAGGYVWHAAWETHKDACDEITNLKRQLPAFEKAGEISIVAAEAEHLYSDFLNNQDNIKQFAQPWIDSTENDMPREIYRLYLLYRQHRQNVLMAISQTPFTSVVTQYAYLPEKPIGDILGMLKDHKDTLKDQAATLTKAFSDKRMISEMDHTC